MKTSALIYRSVSILILAFFVGSTQIKAIYDPLSVPNNVVGIHILNSEDIKPASELVNNNGGDWGYVTLVIREDERDIAKWQTTFDQLRQHRLIPLVRLATKMEQNAWIKPRFEDVDSWVTFLNSLNWVVKNRYVILFNEPNHAKEWGGDINPSEYAQVVELYQKKLKQTSQDFFILPAGIDLAPETTTTTLHPEDFFRGMYKSNPNVFNLLDGWTSHSYPNPAFSASVYNQGRLSIKGYIWEQQLLKKLGLTKQLPIFITETGWVHNQGNRLNKSLLSPEKVATNFSIAYKNIWKDTNIVAITPFILNYPQPPFDSFTWKKPNSTEFYPHYVEVQEFPKFRGEPIQVLKGEHVPRYFPQELVVDSDYYVNIRFLNTGQSIWQPEDTQIDIETSLNPEDIVVDPVVATKPFNQAKIWLRISTKKQLGNHNITAQLKHKNQFLTGPINFTISILPNTPVSHLKLWLQKLIHSNDFI